MSNLNENNLSQLYKYLQLGGKYTTKELSEKFKLSTRTIQIYLKKLKNEYGLQKEKKYYYFPDTFRHMEIDEKIQMSTSLMIALYKNAMPNIEKSVLQNFKQIPKESDVFLFDTDFQVVENKTYFNQITNAIIHETAIHFKYKNLENKSAIKHIYPLKITNILGYWYLMGYDLEQDKIKTYYFNNISDLIISKDESYLSTEKINKLSKKSQELRSPWFNDELQNVKLEINGEAIRYMKRKRSKEFRILKYNGSSLLIEMNYYNDIEILTFVKKWIPFIRIVDNDKLKSKLYNILEKYLKE